MLEAIVIAGVVMAIFALGVIAGYVYSLVKGGFERSEDTELTEALDRVGDKTYR